MKIIYQSLQFEITRRCNQECKHCCRGKSQNIDLTREVVDAFFNNDIVYIGYLTFSGGEPTLNAHMLDYVIDKIIEKKIKVDNFCLSINGLIYSEVLMKAIEKLNNYIQSNRKTTYGISGTVFVSASQYHRLPNEEALKEYSKYKFFVPYKGVVFLEKEDIEPFGNAVINGLSNKNYNMKDIIDYESSYKFIEYNDETCIVFKNKYISSNGNVLINGCLSYDMMDSLAIGNVKDNNLIDMFIKDKEINQFPEKGVKS